MKLIWTDFASENLKRIVQYHQKIAGYKVTFSIKDRIFSTTRLLLSNPKLGQIEPLLEKLQEEHRYLVSGNYKIIYKIIEKEIIITDIFDTRQNPSKINNPSRRKS